MTGSALPEQAEVTIVGAGLAGFTAARRLAASWVPAQWSGPTGRPQNLQKPAWTRGRCGAHLVPGAWTQFGESLRETAVVWKGDIDRAIEAGERAVREIQMVFAA